MSKHHDKCCCESGSGGFAAGGYTYGGYGAGGYGGGFAFNKWIYALLILIVIVLQFGRNRECTCENNSLVGCEETAVCKSSGVLGLGGNEGVIDNSILFIIIVFLLAICGGCWGSGGYGAGGYGY
jgi:Predicted membrane protein